MVIQGTTLENAQSYVNTEKAKQFVTKIAPYIKGGNIKAILLGNEPFLTNATFKLAADINKAIANVYQAMRSQGYDIPVSINVTDGQYENAKNILTSLTSQTKPILFVDLYPWNSKGPYKYQNLDPNQTLASMYYNWIKYIDNKNINIYIAETGWPSSGGEAQATLTNEEKYIRKTVKWIKEYRIPTILFQMKDQITKPGVEAHFGLSTGVPIKLKFSFQ
jgi:exo-beta-1,3-glucanase (GH17 family)